MSSAIRRFSEPEGTDGLLFRALCHTDGMEVRIACRTGFPAEAEDPGTGACPAAGSQRESIAERLKDGEAGSEKKRNKDFADTHTERQLRFLIR